jgi:hypothetical protein
MPCDDAGVTTSVSAADADARRGLRLALAGVAATPATAVLIAVARGGGPARRPAGGPAPRAVTAAMLGLWLGVTAAVLFFWTLVALVL